MVVLGSVHEDHGAVFTERGGRRVVAHYGRPERAHRAVRNGVGVIERPCGVVVLTGTDRHDFVDNSVSNPVPRDDGTGEYALLLNPDGSIALDMYVFDAGDRLLVLTAPGEAETLAADWSEKTFIQDVTIVNATDEFAVFGVHGPTATEKIASVFSVTTPDERLSFVRGRLGDKGVTVVRDDNLAGEEGFLVVARTDAAERVFDTLAVRGLNAAPFGWETWESLTLEAGTPLFESELAGRLPNDLGLDVAVDYEKGCFVGQEVISRIHNRGHPARRLVGLRPNAVPTPGATILADETEIGEVTRAVAAPSLDAPAAFALIDYTVETTEVRIQSEGNTIPATRASLPFVEGSARSSRLPHYD